MDRAPSQPDRATRPAARSLLRQVTVARPWHRLSDLAPWAHPHVHPGIAERRFASHWLATKFERVDVDEDALLTRAELIDFKRGKIDKS